MSSALQALADNRDALLLAEVAAWLHDDFKHTDQQIHNYVSGAPTPSGRQDTADLIPDFEIDFLGKKLKFVLVKNRRGQDFVNGYLNRCHYTAHIEKEDGNSPQTYPAYLSTPFGFEASKIPSNLTDALRNKVSWNLIRAPISDRAKLQRELRDLFRQVGGDTRRPGNEITLWEWGHTVGALYKTALVGAYLERAMGRAPTKAHDLRWRLLSIRTDGLAYLTNVSRLPDLIARQKILQSALDSVQILLEETYPLAAEVYRDENGALYVVPGTPVDLLNLKNDQDKTLLSLIQQEFATDGEIVPQVTLDSEKWWGQDPNRQGNDEIPPAGKLISSPVILQSDASVISDAWQDKQQTICAICGIRPVINSQMEYCQVCGERRKGRLKEWLADPRATIWLDEVADENGRLALITGTFELANWLDGTLVQTMLVQEPTATNQPVTKTPSFARLRRIWRTTQTFWEESQKEANQMLTDARRRLKISLVNSRDLKQNQTYELDLRGQTRMSVLWDGSHLISTDNLSYTATQLGISADERRTPVDAALAVGTWLEECKGSLLQLISDDEKNRRFGIQIADVDFEDTAYATVIPILAEPRTFMTLVPANKAIDVVKAIKAKYEREMGKVRNRLPLHLGVVYADRRTPLRAVLDAGRRMLRQHGNASGWEVKAVRKQPDHGGTLPERFQNDAPGQFAKWYEIDLVKDERQITWYVPAMMGDGQTDDAWYSYVFLEAEAEPTDRTRRFQAPNPFHLDAQDNPQLDWLVHVGELKEGDVVYFTPSTFDFEYLDVSARRFEVAYGSDGRRRGVDKKQRPYLLEEVESLEGAWKEISSLATSQIKALEALIEGKRQAWEKPTGSPAGVSDTFRQFVSDALHQAGVYTPSLEKAALSGMLADALEIYMTIHKEKTAQDTHQKETTHV